MPRIERYTITDLGENAVGCVADAHYSQPTMAIPNNSKSISGELAWTLEHLYRTGVEECVRGGELKHGRNAYWHHALAIFPLAVNAYQAFFNEFIYFNRLQMFDAHHGEMANTIKLHADAFQAMALEEQSSLLPRLLTGRTFEKGQQPFQDFNTLVKIRNALVHFRMNDAPLAAIEHLVRRGLAFPEIRDGGHLAWTDQLSTLECSRWAINTSAIMAVELTSLFGQRHGIGTWLPDERADKIIENSVAKWGREMT